MKLLYLGTAAAEAMPAVFCNCAVCMRARKEKGKNIRARSQMLIDEEMLVDFGPDAYLNAVRFGVDLSAVKHLLITHSHIDHFLPFEFYYRSKGCAENMREEKMNVYGNAAVKEKLSLYMQGQDLAAYGVEFVQIKPFERLQIGAYAVTALPAKHIHTEDAFVFLIEKEEKVLLYCNDTGVLGEDTLAYLEKRNKTLQCISFDCTYATVEAGRWQGHMSLEDNALLFDEMKKRGIADAATQVVCTHFSHWNMRMHDEMQTLADKYGFTIAYDGMIKKL